MKIEFYDENKKTSLRISSSFSLQEIPRVGEHLFLPPHPNGTNQGGTYEVTNTRYLYWSDPRDTDGNEVQLGGIVVYLSQIKEGLDEPIP
jgi:hypothetical protein